MSILLRDHSNYQPPELVRVDYLGTRQLASRKLTVMMGILAQYDTRNPQKLSEYHKKKSLNIYIQSKGKIFRVGAI